MNLNIFKRHSNATCCQRSSSVFTFTFVYRIFTKTIDFPKIDSWPESRDEPSYEACYLLGELTLLQMHNAAHCERHAASLKF
jgi:hypothetical protein